MNTRSGGDEASVTGGKPPKGPCFVDHPLRSALIEEVHARPFAALEPPVQASHLALVSGEHGAAADFAHLVRLCQRYGLSSPTEGSRHFTYDFGTFRLGAARRVLHVHVFLPEPLGATFCHPGDLDCSPRLVRGAPWRTVSSGPRCGGAAQQTTPICGGSGDDFSIRDSFWQSCFRRSGPNVDRLCRS